MANQVLLRALVTLRFLLVDRHIVRSPYGFHVLFTPGDREEMAAALAGLVGHPERRGRLAEEGHRRVHRDLTAARMAERTLEVYRQVLKDRSRGC